MFDLEVVELKTKLIEEINNSNIPLVVIKYILDDINKEVANGLNLTLDKQRTLREEQQRNLLNIEQEGLIDGEL